MQQSKFVIWEIWFIRHFVNKSLLILEWFETFTSPSFCYLSSSGWLSTKTYVRQWFQFVIHASCVFLYSSSCNSSANVIGTSVRQSCLSRFYYFTKVWTVVDVWLSNHNFSICVPLYVCCPRASIWPRLPYNDNKKWTYKRQATTFNEVSNQAD